MPRGGSYSVLTLRPQKRGPVLLVNSTMSSGRTPRGCCLLSQALRQTSLVIYTTHVPEGKPSGGTIQYSVQ